MSDSLFFERHSVEGGPPRPRLSEVERQTLGRVVLRVKRLTPTAKLPEYKTAGAAGFDLSADIPQPLTIAARERALILTGLAFDLPPGYELQIRSRSGLAFNAGLIVLNAPGTIDADFRGNVGVILYNAGDIALSVKPGDRIAQAVLAKFERLPFLEVGELSKTDRGAGAFGSTGVK